MSSSLIEIIRGAMVAARSAGLDESETLDAARAVLLARDASLSPGMARILVEQLHSQATADMAA